MQSLFVWIVMFAGAVVALLGLFLVASERELKNKRREIENLLAKLEEAPQGNAPAQAIAPQQDNSAPLAELRQTNVTGTAALLEFARQCPRLRRFIHLSTTCVAGDRCGRRR